MITKTIAKELRTHAPFTAFGALTGIVIVALMAQLSVPRAASEQLFWFFHPVHVLLSATVTAGMYRLHGKGGLWQTIVIGYIGSVGIATLSDCVIPYAGEVLLDLPHRHIHLGVFEKWWLVNPLAAAGIALGYFRPSTKFPHAGHVLLSTWASLFHMTMAIGPNPDTAVFVLIATFLFLAVWVPCCTSDIVFPLLFSRK
ncbi:hypothetical protein ACFL34_01515 [Candidatus Sumerlaeota bacterium]